MRTLLMMAALGASVTGCSSSDACDGLATCLALTASPPAGTPLSVDQLIVTVTGQVNGTRTLPTTPNLVTLPQTVALEFMPPDHYMGSFAFAVAVVGNKAGSAVANGSGQVTMTTGKHQLLTVQMAPGAPQPGGGANDLATGAPPADMLSKGP